VYRRSGGTRAALNEQNIMHSSLEQGMKISVGDRFFVDKRIISAVKRVEFVGSRIS
jgi:hypothetical protein